MEEAIPTCDGFSIQPVVVTLAFRMNACVVSGRRAQPWKQAAGDECPGSDACYGCLEVYRFFGGNVF